MDEEDLVLIGNVVGVHGIKGKVKVFPYTESPETFKALKAVWLKNRTGGLQKCELKSASVGGKTVLLVLSGVSSRTEAEALIHCEVYCPKKWFQGLPANEYYWHQIIGLTVQLEDGSVLGTIKAILPTGSNDVYVVEKRPKEYLIPAIEDVIVSIDLALGVMTIRPLEDLLDMNDL